ncbi:hypothetical protein ES707_21528 [subsurface metagenome]
MAPGQCENCWTGKGYSDRALPKAVLDSWMKSPGHRANLLDPSVRTEGVAISRSRHGIFATWQGSYSHTIEEGLGFTFPKINLPRVPKLKIVVPELKIKIRSVRIDVWGWLLRAAAVVLIILGSHGFYVYTHRADLALLNAHSNDLFLSFNLPNLFDGLVSWMSTEGTIGWIIPIAFLVGGALLYARVEGHSLDDVVSWKPLNIFLRILAIVVIVLGVHGIYVYIHRHDWLIISASAEDLFLTLDVPDMLDGLIFWMTAEGIHGWFIPIVFIVGGLIAYSEIKDRLS